MAQTAGTPSPERLRQIAARKLTALGVITRLGTDGATLEGELVLPRRTPPRVRFAVIGHDRFRLVDPPFAGVPPVAFYDAESTAELEARVAAAISGRAPPRPTEPTASEPPSALREEPPGAQALTVDVLKRLGGGLTIQAPGLELHQFFEVGGVRYRFSAVHQAGTVFKGRLLSPSGEKWAEKFDAERFPGAAELVRTVLGIPSAPPTAESPVASAARVPQPVPAVPSHLAPQAGETWVMNVLVESEAGGEIRYVCTDIDGRPYGAARVLKRTDFESVFCQDKGGWRLRILIDACEGDRVTYRQLDSQRQPRGAAKVLATATLVTTFVPEAAAY
ncbi:MAG TPA: hypothetical protein VEY30_11025 [Myxococcaceae bacterium]|nr:hypothetical protein [Myxococcaceae bacterium]